MNLLTSYSDTKKSVTRFFNELRCLCEVGFALLTVFINRGKGITILTNNYKKLVLFCYFTLC